MNGLRVACDATSSRPGDAQMRLASEPPTGSALDGTWVPVAIKPDTREAGFDARTAEISFGDGSWHGSDGCNPLRGTFAQMAERFVATADGFYGVGCLRGFIAYDRILVSASRVEISGQRATFTDSSGTVVLVLRKVG
jgi:hypothetical protein